MKSLILYASVVLWATACNPFQESGRESDVALQNKGAYNGIQEQRVRETRPKLNEMLTAAEISLDSHEVVLEDSLHHNAHLTLRSDGPQWPVILEVIGPKGNSTYYFQHQKLIAIETPAQHFILENDKLKVWTNQNWIPYKDKSTEEWLDQESALLLEVENYLAAFDINY